MIILPKLVDGQNIIVAVAGGKFVQKMKIIIDMALGLC